MQTDDSSHEVWTFRDIYQAPKRIVLGFNLHISSYIYILWCIVYLQI